MTNTYGFICVVIVFTFRGQCMVLSRTRDLLTTNLDIPIVQLICGTVLTSVKGVRNCCCVVWANKGRYKQTDFAKGFLNVCHQSNNE